MKQQLLAQRYAKALFELAQDREQLDPVLADLQTFAKTLSGSTELSAVFVNPVYELESREAIVSEICKKLDIGPMVTNYLLLLIRKKRTELFETSVTLYQRLLDAHSNRTHVRVVSAAPLSDDYVQQLKAGFVTEGAEVSVESTVDAALVGGVRAWVGDRLYDGSLRTRLDNLKDQLLKQV